MSASQITPPGAPRKVLVANRGEIAARICRSVFDCGWGSVAVVAKGESRLGHAARADEAVELPGAGAAAYLDASALVEAALRSGCDMVHPGYGFLSEAPAFAEACRDAGLIFVGPSAQTLALFGDKSRARAVAAACEASPPPGGGVLADVAALVAFMAGQGGPVMLKAVSGGGGRGIRIVRDPGQAAEAFARCRSEAETAFGDGRLYAEALIEGARHVEVQIAGDGTGAVAILGDRECSLQRQRQKLVEFAPASGLSPQLRHRLFEAARRIGAHVDYRGIGTVEFLVKGEGFHFLEVNPRLQVEHTVTEAVTGLDLVALQFRLALGGRLEDEALPAPDAPRSCAVQLRVNAETMSADGACRPSAGRLAVFDLPNGPGVRVDTAAGVGHEVTPDYDALLAKLIVHCPGDDRRLLLRRACRALCETTIEGVGVNLDFLRALLVDPQVLADEVDVGFVDRNAGRLIAAGEAHPSYVSRAQRSGQDVEPHAFAPAPAGLAAIRAEIDARLTAICVAEGDAVVPGQVVAILEAMKMEFSVLAEQGGVVRGIEAAPGAAVRQGAPLILIAPDGRLAEDAEHEEAVDLAHVRDDLRAILEARHRLSDAARPEAVARRRAAGRRTARENIADLCDAGSFHEYGGFALAAQRGRRSPEELAAMSPADGMAMGVGTVNAAAFGEDRARCAVLAYDYTVFAGTQGVNAHIKKNRLFRLVGKHRLPLVMFVEGGGGRPGDTDDHGFLKLYNPTFHAAAKLKSRVPIIAIAAGPCFAGNAALAACADVVIATRDASIGMGGPAMISGGGLGEVAAADVGPVSMQGPNGVVDLVVEDEAEAVAAARAILSFVQGDGAPGPAGDQRVLRHVVPEAPRRAYRMRDVIAALVDGESFVELRAAFGTGMITGFARIAGRPFAILANDPLHLAGALDAAAAAKAAEFAPLVEKLGLPLLKLVDTPGFMVGPAAEAEGLVRQAGRMFAAGAILSVPQFTVVVRKAYGLGALAMVFGNAHEQVLTVAWPSGHFGKMGLEGQVRLAYRKELAALPDDASRQARLMEMVAALHAQGSPLNAAAYLSVDEVIDPLETRDWLLSGLSLARSAPAMRDPGLEEPSSWDL
ncbi:carboxyl transferase domain-containing protein [uncultured Albimonas sp.]|uniref:carboxyl transferase domain-containing protein n=1 Tax=uncultured Albimonas sp. TaxID=1331701 RepID=UPI0030EC49A7